MTRKDYVLIASVFAEEIALSRGDGEKVGPIVLRDAARNMASTLKRDNPRFNRDRFLTACNTEGN